MVMISAHRGGAGERTHLENTRMAMEEALELGVDFVEFDVQRCGDGTFILFHDDHVVSESGAVMLSEISFVDFKKYASNFMLYDDALHLLLYELLAVFLSQHLLDLHLECLDQCHLV